MRISMPPVVEGAVEVVSDEMDELVIIVELAF